MTKQCPACNRVLDVSNFGKSTARRDGLLTYCRECANAKARAYRATKEGREKRKEYHTQWRKDNPEYKIQYRSNEARRVKLNIASVVSNRKISEEGIADLLLLQQGCCKICGIDFGTLKRQYNVDHDHKTGRIRGLLCPECNTKLGTYEKWVLPNLTQITAYLEGR